LKINTKLLRSKIECNDMNIASFAVAIGVNPSTLYRKLDGGGYSFTVGQMHKTVEVLGLTKEEAVQIFLN